MQRVLPVLAILGKEKSIARIRKTIERSS